MIEKKIDDLEAHLTEKIDGLMDRVEDKITPLRDEHERKSRQIDELYNHDRDRASEGGDLRSRVAQLEQGQKDKERSGARTVAILSIVIGALGLSGGGLIAAIVGGG